MPLINPEAWGSLRARYETSQPRCMLSLDGGGIKGIISLHVLKALESQLRECSNLGERFRLCHFFDYVGGTSTGAIIAAGIARGLSVDQLLPFYKTFGTEVFKKRRWGIWESLYADGALAQKLQKVYGELSTLRPDDLKTLLLVVTRNATTDSAWPISSNPAAKYNEQSRPDCNLKIPLWQLVRASTAAPVFFPPEVIEWEQGNSEKAFVFVDGGTTAYNNPAFLMTRMATAPEYRLNWEKGEDKLLVVSVGAGTAPVLGSQFDDPYSSVVSSAFNTLKTLMSQAAFDQDINCRTIGRCRHGLPLDREVGDLIPRIPTNTPIGDSTDNIIPLEKDLGRNFLYVRYDADLSPDGLHAMGLSKIKSDSVNKLDAVDNLSQLEDIGKKLAEEVDLKHLGSFIDRAFYSGS